MAHNIHIDPVVSKRDLRAFVRFPWKVYAGDANWVPPLISERLKQLDPEKNPYVSRPHLTLHLARRGREPVGTIAAFVDRSSVEHLEVEMGGFGFFEVIQDYGVAKRLLDVACGDVRRWGMKGIRGPTNFGIHNEPGLLLQGHDSPPALLEAHTPPYYQQFVERYGMQKYRDLYAWRAHLPDLGENLERMPEQIQQVFEAVSRRGGVTVRKLRMDDWDREVEAAHELFNATLDELPEHVPMSLEAFRGFAEGMRSMLDPDIALFAEADGRTVGFIVAIPDPNRLLHKLNGHLFPLGWLKMLWYRRRIDQVTFKLFGLRKEYRRRGIDTLLYYKAIKAAAERGYRWLDGSTTSEFNPGVIRMAERLGAERYKWFRLYQMRFEPSL
jgi:GNAT superfamily N-acetyltransferase